MTLAMIMLSQAVAAGPFAGLEIRPLSRADLVWVGEERTSGLAVGEFDGTVRPSVSAFVGYWFNRYVGLSGHVGLAWVTASTQVDGLARRQDWGVVRPGLDVRIGWMEPLMHKPVPWFFVGVHGDIPTVRDVDASRTEAQQEAANGAALTERYRLGGVGGRVGAGLDYRLLPGLAIGATLGVGLHRSLFIGGDAGLVSWWVQTDAALLLTFEWPRKAARSRDE